MRIGKRPCSTRVRLSRGTALVSVFIRVWTRGVWQMTRPPDGPAACEAGIIGKWSAGDNCRGCNSLSFGRLMAVGRRVGSGAGWDGFAGGHRRALGLAGLRKGEEAVG